MLLSGEQHCFGVVLVLAAETHVLALCETHYLDRRGRVEPRVESQLFFQIESARAATGYRGLFVITVRVAQGCRILVLSRTTIKRVFIVAVSISVHGASAENDASGLHGGLAQMVVLVVGPGAAVENTCPAFGLVVPHY